MKLVKITLVLPAFALFIIACAETKTTQTNVPANTIIIANTTAKPTAALDELAVGREIYITNCARCHKEDGTGGKVDIEGKTINADNLTTDKMKKMSDEKYIGYIENGIPDEGMPAFKGKLTDQQIKEVVNYVRKEIQK